MGGKALRSAIVAGGAVAALQLAYFVVTSGPGCTVVAGSRTACTEGNLAVAGVGVVMMLSAMTWGFRMFLGLQAALLGTILTATGVYAVLRVGLEPGWGADDPLAGALPLIAAGFAFVYMRIAMRNRLDA
jgi:hypothetical protein